MGASEVSEGPVGIQHKHVQTNSSHMKAAESSSSRQAEREREREGNGI